MVVRRDDHFSDRFDRVVYRQLIGHAVTVARLTTNCPACGGRGWDLQEIVRLPAGPVVRVCERTLVPLTPTPGSESIHESKPEKVSA